MGGPEHQGRAGAEYPREDRSFRLYRANRAAAGHGKRGILLGLGDRSSWRHAGMFRYDSSSFLAKAQTFCGLT